MMKLDNLERGEAVFFRIKVPVNLNNLMTEYHSRSGLSVKKKPS